MKNGLLPIAGEICGLMNIRRHVEQLRFNGCGPAVPTAETT